MNREHTATARRTWRTGSVLRTVLTVGSLVVAPVFTGPALALSVASNPVVSNRATLNQTRAPLSPKDDPEINAIAVPAEGEIRCIWRVTGGQMHQDCSFVATGCPSSMTFTEEVDGVGSVEMTCDLDCHGRGPDSNGNCDCDVVTNTCQSTR